MPKFGTNITMEVYGESHGECIGVIMSGLKGVKVDLDALQAFAMRRKASNSTFSTKRIEPDIIEIKSGVSQDGTILSDAAEFVVYNKNQRSSDYSNIASTPRPSHADYPAKIKYGLDLDLSGGGKYSGRLTLPICIAGGIAEQILTTKNIYVASYLSEVAGIKGKSYKQNLPTVDELEKAKADPFYFLRDNIELIQEKLKKAQADQDSLGGIIETVVLGMPIGIGDSLFDGLEGHIASALFGIPAVKGVEFGTGFDIARMTGSQANDEYYYDDNKVKTYTNNNGGIVGGMSNGQAITIRAVIKPTPSIGKTQRTIDLINKTNTQINIKGRHDVCIAPRAVAPVEAMVSFALLDMINGEKYE